MLPTGLTAGVRMNTLQLVAEAQRLRAEARAVLDIYLKTYERQERVMQECVGHTRRTLDCSYRTLARLRRLLPD